ncbi:MAG: hypothetical protein K5764_06550 [Prevotella sp.]|nr:hypothetical protein [Prevotella sp.]
MRKTIIFLLSLILVGCHFKQAPKHFTHELMNRMTPIKDQGENQTCWVYAMLAAIETEHLRWGDSVNLSPAYVEKMLEREPLAPKNKRGTSQTLIYMIQKYGIVGYNAMRTTDTPAPRFVFLGGAEYTPQEFARSVCAPDEYIALSCDDRLPYYQEVDTDIADNWTNSRYYNIPVDTLLAKTERAVRHHHGVYWEDRGHGMAIVGIARDDSGAPYFIMKNSWGTDHPYQGLAYVSFQHFLSKTVAVEMTKEAFQQR